MCEVAAGPVTLSRNQRSEQEQYHHHLNGTSQNQNKLNVRLLTPHQNTLHKKHVSLHRSTLFVSREPLQGPFQGNQEGDERITWPLPASTCSPRAREQAKMALHAIGTDCFGPTYQSSAAFWTTKKVLKPAGQHALSRTLREALAVHTGTFSP